MKVIHSVYRNILGQLTGKKKYILQSFLVILFGLSANNAFAVTFQNNVGVEFTFNSTLSISLSSADLLIANLAPGASASSNTITVSVDTNNITGYTLSATVGDGTTYTNDKLVNSSSNTYFDNLTSSSTLANFGNNKWGYALGTISSSSTYSGLVYNTDTIINATTNASGTAATGYTGTNNTSFTIGAKASDTQASGDYKNVIVFTVVGNTVPESLPIMQKVATWKNSLNIGDEIQAVDARDGKVYYVAKLADGNIWMTQNLDHDIVTTANYYTPENTDVNTNWTAGSATHVTSDTSWVQTNTAIQSYDPGDKCWSGTFGTTNLASLSSCTQNGNHYHLGNYYNWSAAVANNDTSSYGASGKGQPNLPDTSICPAGWGLPRAGTGSDTFYSLTNGRYSTGEILAASPAYFVPNYPGSSTFGSNGQYWSAVSYAYSNAYILSFSQLDINPSNGDAYRYEKRTVRCLARPLSTSLTDASGYSGGPL